ncbi:MAG TPA: hypothetical protein PLY23_00120 [Alphaproteobacteria bacterium]|nr:hypothetical protein [Alphaproteobacteria bacterium]HQS93150.1 hypothetical protein [Alphaproteobacteria bacterium]
MNFVKFAALALVLGAFVAPVMADEAKIDAAHAVLDADAAKLGDDSKALDAAKEDAAK